MCPNGVKTLEVPDVPDPPCKESAVYRRPGAFSGTPRGNMNATDNFRREGSLHVSDRKNDVPNTVTSIPLVDPHAPKPDPSIGDLVKDATAQVSTLVRAEVELAKAEITRDVKKGLTGSVFFIAALVVLFYSTFFFFFFLAELLDNWLWKWAAYLIVFGIMVVLTALLALFGYLKVRRIRGPQKTIETVKELPDAFTPGPDKRAVAASKDNLPATQKDPSGW